MTVYTRVLLFGSVEMIHGAHEDLVTTIFKKF